jgi:hypothetical protein
MVDIRLLDKAPELQKPRRVMKYVLVWCATGDLTLVVDEDEFVLKANTVITITSGQVHYIKKSTAATA